MQSENKQIARNLIFNIISFGVNIFISLFFTPYLIRTLGKEAYSFFPLVNNIINFNNILTAAVGSMAGRFITMKFYKNDIEGANQYFNSIWVANIVLSIFFTIVSIFAIVFIANILTVPDILLTDVRLMFVFSAAAMIIGLLTGMFGLGTFVKNRVDLQSGISVITHIVRVIAIILLFYFLSPTIVFMSLSGFISALVGMYFNLSFKKRLLPELSFSPVKYFNWKDFAANVNFRITA
ncbi:MULTISPECIES: hypothetical protein [Segatella]|uniref:Polysaccharide biosynthesis protein C-terminal domain-containing protein n=2 Tax=Segatella TaxID=2974251 RepID=A0AA37I489_SEGBR|nr:MULTISPECIES: hypothetical protein [Segatella]EFI70849.1 putative flippase [Segatella baroniae B14]UKK79758.1 hypothetical protein L6469_11385 [Segatella baroniae B14]GJG28725.1 hypothetical protein PRRU23_24250 [Segatella bryantii]SEQ99226.1 hypothetical protein SAMN05444375_11944 [Segatella baroniae B14]